MPLWRRRRIFPEEHANLLLYSIKEEHVIANVKLLVTEGLRPKAESLVSSALFGGLWPNRFRGDWVPATRVQGHERI